MEICYCHCGSIEYGCMRLCTHKQYLPMRDSSMSAHAHATAQRALDYPALLRKNGFVISMQCSLMLKKQPIAVIFEVICAKKLGKGPFKSLDFQCNLWASQL